MLTRRELLARGALGGAVVALPPAAYRTAAAQAAGPAPYAMELPLPPLAQAISSSAPNRYELTLMETAHRWHPRLPLDTIWGYSDDGSAARAMSPGPVIQAQRGVPTELVTYRYELPEKHRLSASVDRTLWAGHGMQMSDVRGLTHLHGGFIKGSNDGNPFANQDYEMKTTQEVVYPNEQRAGMIWYHDHAHFITRLNVMAGLFGAYVIRDTEENGVGDTGASDNPLELPAGPYEIPLVVQDRSFDRKGALTYPAAPWVPEFYGEEIVVNGAIAPYMRIESNRVYRMRFLNGSNARFFNLAFRAGKLRPPRLYQIGTDGGLMNRAVPVDTVLLAPGERADVLVDFSQTRYPVGTEIFVRNLTLPAAVVSPGTQRRTVMKFVVESVASAPNTSVEQIDARLEAAGANDNGEPELGSWTEDPRDRTGTRNITLEEVLMDGMPMPLLNGKGFHAEDEGGDRVVDETPQKGAIEEWRFVNMTPDSHPIHLHLVMFQVAERWSFDSVLYHQDLLELRDEMGYSPGDETMHGPDVAWHQDPPPGGAAAPSISPFNPKYGPVKLPGGVADCERGWKDTVRADPGQITVIRTQFDPAPGPSSPMYDSSSDDPHKDDKYVFHCHILEHEDHDMMRPYQLV